MDPMIRFLLLLLVGSSFPRRSLTLAAKPTKPALRTRTSQISVVGVVYCDVCQANTFSKYSYFLPGADVNIQCKLKVSAPKTAERIDFSVNRTTDNYGVYKLEIPSVDGIDCVDGAAIASMCGASLIGSSSPDCNVPGLRTTTNEVSVKSKQDNLCILSMDALSYRPPKKNTTLCGNQKQESADTLNSSKFFLPYFPPYRFPWPPIPQLPFHPVPPFPSIPFPFPPFPFPNSPPSLPFPFPTLPPFPPSPSLPSPTPPAPAFNLTDPRTWFPNIPFFSPPPPPPFDLKDPRTWLPHFPPYSPPRPENQKP
ncbi:pollen-specific leucine-rich repeat extensin-like protein 4 [Punica granatum]|uniref:Uncharacterized protein n=2 Tax=Punica granatum TaxID=22663 RepID=A0A218WUP1_PUNGR|nr:pollen-specific leucine-rich repeat extensin-like protein 4 [Punica granatum]OWM76238.1 hypothetical protein CDL15_Pgr009884 [Punica granatum]PKI76964.1 hypothetical protein CRG98_002467 [Punica granatum]